MITTWNQEKKWSGRRGGFKRIFHADSDNDEKDDNGDSDNEPTTKSMQQLW